jgi:hypothetical protein
VSLFPKAPEPKPAPTPPVVADAAASAGGAGPTATAIPESLISTSARGLKRKASTVKPSLIGGSPA